MAKNYHIAFITPYPFDTAPSQRFRFEQYYTVLLNANIKYVNYPFLSQKSWAILYKKGNQLSKIAGVLSGFLKRFLLLFSLSKYDYVFIHREASPIGPPIFEWVIAKILQKKIIYDFDDSIWLANTSSANRLVAKLKWHAKVSSICKWSHKISCGNQYLMTYAKQYNPNVVFNPTTINLNYQNHQKKNHQKTEEIILGWTGSHSTLKYLDLIIDEIIEIAKGYKIKLLVICNERPEYQDDFIEYIKWSSKTEINDLLKIDIGLMPLTEDKWSNGKCGFKALQYMSLGIPCVVSPVGVNNDIIQNKKNGFLAKKGDWVISLEGLIKSIDLRQNIGENGFDFVQKKYSTQSNADNFLSLFLS